MAIVYMVPGLMGSQLWTGAGESSALWVSYPRLALGELRGLALAPNGIDPLAPHGQACTAGFPLRDFYDMAIYMLQSQLAPHGYAVSHHSYDWRMRSIPQGVELADRIRDEVTAADPCAIVAHSKGGFLARAAWQSLLATGQSNLVRRIITLGTPHQGSYAAVGAWCLSDETLDTIFPLLNLVPIITWVAGFPITIPTMSMAGLAALCGTWPGFYETLPLLGSADSAADPHREYLYTASNWPADRGVTQANLDYARLIFGPFLRAANSIPPPWVLTTVGGTGVPTRRRLWLPAELGDPSCMDVTDDGDSLITDESAIIPGSRSYYTYDRHVDLPLSLALSGQLANWVREVRVAPEPAPEPVHLTAPLIPRLGALPVGRSLLPGPTGCGSYCC